MMQVLTEASGAERRVVLRPFVRQADGPETVIGRPGDGVFLAIPNQALQVLDWLAEGATIGEAGRRHRAACGEEADLTDFLAQLEARGFVQVLPAGQDGAPAPAPDGPAPAADHFAWISQRTAAWVFNRVTVTAAVALVVSGAAVALARPRLLPGWRALAYEDGILPVALALLAIDLFATFVHEMAHLVAARARGVGARLGLGNRLWILVAECDLTGLWRLPPRQRYLPLLAGPLADGATAAVLVLTLLAASRGAPLPPAATRAAQALLMIYLLKLAWQLYFFLRTDLYYVVAGLLRCKNLMGDTETLLANQVRRLLRRRGLVDQSHIPVRERRVIRAYAAVWVAGRIAALFVLVAITLPLVLHYVGVVAAGLRDGAGASPYRFVESVTVSATSVLLFAAGCWLWVRNALARR